MNTPREWQRCEQAAGWIWLVHAASNEGKLILRKWEALASEVTYLALCTLCLSAFRKDVLFQGTLMLRKSVHVPTYACVTHHLYKTCVSTCVHAYTPYRPNISLLLYFSAEGQEENPEGQTELQMGRNTDLFWEVNMHYLKALLEGP